MISPLVVIWIVALMLQTVRTLNFKLKFQKKRKMFAYFNIPSSNWDIPASVHSYANLTSLCISMMINVVVILDHLIRNGNGQFCYICNICYVSISHMDQMTRRNKHMLHKDLQQISFQRGHLSSGYLLKIIIFTINLL